MPLVEIERNDIIATKDGRSVRVQKIYMNGDKLSKIEGIDDSEVSPMLRPVFAHEIARVLRKANQASAATPAHKPVEEKLAPEKQKAPDKDRQEEATTAAQPKGGK